MESEKISFNGLLTVKKDEHGWHVNLIPKGYLYMHSTFGFTIEESLQNLSEHILKAEKILPRYLVPKKQYQKSCHY